MEVQSQGFTLEGVRIEARLGLMATIEAEALVCSSGPGKRLIGSHSAAWLQEADRDGSISAALQRYGSTQLGEVVVTHAGTLGAKYLLNAAVIDWKQKHTRSQLVDDTIVFEATRKCIQIAASLGLRSIAFTPWGTRKGGGDAKRITAVMLYAMIDALLDDCGTLEVVYVVSNVVEHYNWFVDRLSIFELLFAQLLKVRQEIKQLEISEAERSRLLGMIKDIGQSVVVYNEITHGDRISMGTIAGGTVAAGSQSSAETHTS
jgi:O-acetyl-ADP-ribose deacetylase (regulator of RNase III)